MSFKRCPGSTTLSQPTIEIMPCPHCGSDVEIWSDEADGRCLSCKRTVTRTSTNSCLDWCQHAEACIGEEKYKKYKAMKAKLKRGH